jgi:hypothetical protein
MMQPEIRPEKCNGVHESRCMSGEQHQPHVPEESEGESGGGKCKWKWAVVGVYGDESVCVCRAGPAVCA